MNASSEAVTVAVFCSFSQATLFDNEHRLLIAFVQSVRRQYQNSAKILLLTDEYLTLDTYRLVFDDIRRFPIDKERLLLGRCVAYHHTIVTHDWLTPLIFLDYDILMLKPLDFFSTLKEDIFLTARPYAPSMPINGGVLMLNNLQPSKGIKFYESVLANYRALNGNTVRWWGDQISLSIAAMNDARVVGSDVLLSKSGALVRLLPRVIYNFTPYDVDSGVSVKSELDQDTLRHLKSNVVLAHFKGPRKHLMVTLAASISDHNQPVD